MNDLERVAALLEEKRALDLDEASHVRWGEIRDEVKAIKARVDIETFGSIRDLEMRQHDVNEQARASMTKVCVCGHRRGMHSLLGCPVGTSKWNAREGRNDPFCGCRGFLLKAEYDRMEAEEAIEKAERKATAELWCETCDDEVVEPTAKYECGSCGAEFTYADEGSNRCPDCSKFASKLDGEYCSDCGEEVTA